LRKDKTNALLVDFWLSAMGCIQTKSNDDQRQESIFALVFWSLAKGGRMSKQIAPRRELVLIIAGMVLLAGLSVALGFMIMVVIYGGAK
jgi:hypothetical protein